MEMIKDYLLLGIGVYLGCASARAYLLKTVTKGELVLGILFIVLWPLGLVLSTLEALYKGKPNV